MLGASSCAQAIHAQAGYLGPEEKTGLSQATVTAVSINGEQAQVPDSSILDSNGHPVPLPSGNPAPITLQKFNNQWLVTDSG